MPRRYRRRHRYTVARPLKTAKYSNETYTMGRIGQMNTTQVGQNVYAITLNAAVVPATNVLGTRKVKNFTVRIKTYDLIDSQQATTPTLFQWALVFVPEGLTPSTPVIGAGSFASMYEPNQNVIMSGLSDGEQVYVSKTRLARNLNSGDNIYFLITSEVVPQGNYSVNIYAQINYAISF